MRKTNNFFFVKGSTGEFGPALFQFYQLRIASCFLKSSQSVAYPSVYELNDKDSIFRSVYFPVPDMSNNYNFTKNRVYQLQAIVRVPPNTSVIYDSFYLINVIVKYINKIIVY